MNTKYFFEKAKESGIEPCSLDYKLSKSIEINVYQDELENYTIANDTTLSARGIFCKKVGSFKSDRTDRQAIPYIIEGIKSSAEHGLDGNPDFFIEKGQKYHRVNTYSKTLSEVPPEKLIALAKRLSAEIRKRESRITICEVSVKMAEVQHELSNSRGIALKSRSNYVILYSSVNIAQGEELESAFKLKIFSDLADFDENAFVDSVIQEAVAKLGSHSIKSGKYDVLFDKTVVPLLLKPLLEQLSAFAVKEHLSLFEGKLEQQVLSKKLTILENPHSKTPFAFAFDDEGMPTQKKILFNRGVLKTYLYDLETAKEQNTQSTGNGELQNGNIRPALGFVELKAGRKSFDETVSELKKAVYITSVEGIQTGLNTSSGDYSLQAEGFLIENGKITEPVSLITVAGNLLTDFAKVSQVANDSALSHKGFFTPSLVIKKLAISGN